MCHVKTHRSCTKSLSLVVSTERSLQSRKRKTTISRGTMAGKCCDWDVVMFGYEDSPAVPPGLFVRVLNDRCPPSEAL